MAVRIAIVDTGVNRSHPWLQDCEIDGISVSGDAAETRFSSGFDDDVNHGTVVAAVIHAFCPKAALYAVRVTGGREDPASELATEEAVAAAIQRCRDAGIRIVNVSYSFQRTRSDVLAQTCRRARDDGMVIVAAYSNGDRGPVYPACLADVIGVRHSSRLLRGQIEIASLENKDVAAWGGPVSMVWPPGQAPTLWGGTSFAAAHVSAMVARMHFVDDTIDLSRAFEFLKALEAPGNLSEHVCEPSGVGQ